jgi:hypothetical protein
MSNGLYIIVRTLLQKPRLSREIFVNNKKKYNLTKSKQGFNRIITRKMYTNSIPFSSFGKGPGGKGPKLPVALLFIASLSAYISYNFNKKT